MFSFRDCHPHLVTCFLTRVCSGLCTQAQFRRIWRNMACMGVNLCNSAPRSATSWCNTALFENLKECTALRHDVCPPAAATSHQRHPSDPSSTSTVPDPPPAPHNVKLGDSGLHETRFAAFSPFSAKQEPKVPASVCPSSLSRPSRQPSFLRRLSP